MSKGSVLGGGALPAWMYRDPMEAAMRLEARSCNGCRHLIEIPGAELCGVGRRETVKCKRFELKKLTNK